MSEIGVERFGAGHDQKHRAQRDEPNHAVAEQEFDAVGRIERPQHRRILSDVPQSGRSEHDEPEQTKRPEEGRNARRAPRLHREQRHQDHHGQRHDIRLERRRHDFRPSTADNTDSAGVRIASP